MPLSGSDTGKTTRRPGGGSGFNDGKIPEDGERIDDLGIAGLRIIQNPNKFCFGIDAVMLANFATVKRGYRGGLWYRHRHNTR